MRVGIQEVIRPTMANTYVVTITGEKRLQMIQTLQDLIPDYKRAAVVIAERGSKSVDPKWTRYANSLDTMLQALLKAEAQR